MKYSYSTEKIARILRVKPEVLQKLCFDMDKMCHKSGILDQIVAENDFKVKEILSFLGLDKNSKSEEIYQAIISKLKDDDQKLYKILKEPRGTDRMIEIQNAIQEGARAYIKRQYSVVIVFFAIVNEVTSQ